MPGLDPDIQQSKYMAAVRCPFIRNDVMKAA
jgi:hypothetical protein